MNLYGLRYPHGDDMEARAAMSAFIVDHAKLVASSGSQAVHRARRLAEVEPPDPTSDVEKSRRRERGRAKHQRRASR